MEKEGNHLWISCTHARQHSRQHLPALLTRATGHCQFEQIHHHASIVRNKQACELIEVLWLWSDHFTLTLRVLKNNAVQEYGRVGQVRGKHAVGLRD